MSQMNMLDSSLMMDIDKSACKCGDMAKLLQYVYEDLTALVQRLKDGVGLIVAVRMKIFLSLW